MVYTKNSTNVGETKERKILFSLPIICPGREQAWGQSAARGGTQGTLEKPWVGVETEGKSWIALGTEGHVLKKRLCGKKERGEVRKHKSEKTAGLEEKQEILPSLCCGCENFIFPPPHEEFSKASILNQGTGEPDLLGTQWEDGLVLKRVEKPGHEWSHPLARVTMVRVILDQSLSGQEQKFI